MESGCRGKKIEAEEIKIIFNVYPFKVPASLAGIFFNGAVQKKFANTSTKYYLFKNMAPGNSPNDDRAI